MKINTEISAYILAGGKSKRMGADKGLLLLEGKQIVSYIIDELQQVTDDVTIISSNELYRKFEIKMTADEINEKGPAAGIDTALQTALHEIIFITSCDMPFINQESIRSLLQHAQHHDITVCMHENFIEPLFAIYKKRCKEQWRQLLLQGTLKLTDYFSHFDTNFVDANEFLEVNPHLFLNVNTPEDLRTAAQWMKK